MAKEFDGLEYTREALAEELALVERHSSDGSAVQAGCSCIEEKHLLNLAGLASEGVTLAADAKEKEFYMELAGLARELRRRVLDGKFSMHGAMRETMKARAPQPQACARCLESHSKAKCVEVGACSAHEP